MEARKNGHSYAAMDSGNGLEIALGELITATPAVKAATSVLNDASNAASSHVLTQGVHAHGAGAMSSRSLGGSASSHASSAGYSSRTDFHSADELGAASIIGSGFAQNLPPHVNMAGSPVLGPPDAPLPPPDTDPHPMLAKTATYYGSDDPADILVRLKHSGGSARRKLMDFLHDSPPAHLQQGNSDSRFEYLLAQCKARSGEWEDNETKWPQSMGRMGLLGTSRFPPKNKKVKTAPPRAPPVPQPPRQSLPLCELAILEADGTFTCKKCGKRGFRLENSLRSHLSHCPVTKAEREERRRLLAVYLSLGGDAENFTAQREGELRRREAQDGLPPLPTHFGAPPMTAGTNSTSTSQPPYKRRTSSYDGDSMSMGGIPSLFPARKDTGTPLVPSIFEHGAALVGRHVSVDLDGTGRWAEARLSRYNQRTGTHQAMFVDDSVLWGVLTTTNCRLRNGDAGEGPAASGAATMMGQETATRPPAQTKLGGTYTEGFGQAGARAPSTTGVGPNEATTATKNALFDQCDRMIGRKTKRRASFFDSQATDMTDAVDKASFDATLGGGRRTRPRVADTNGSSHSADEALEAALWGDSKLSATQLQDFAHEGYTFTSGTHEQPSVAPKTRLASVCPRCRAKFANKQTLGWHTKKRVCQGAPITPSPADIEVGALGGEAASTFDHSAAMEVDVPVLGKRSMEAEDEDSCVDEGRGRKKPRSG